MKVLVTGAAGYIAGHCIRELLAHGHTVRGTVRDPSDDAKVAYLHKLGDIELVAADLTRDAGWSEAVAGCDAVMHTASPFFITDDESELIGPAVDGTLRVLKAAANAGIKRVVMTSSTAAIVNCTSDVYTEEQWSLPAECSPYPKSKTLAERAAWDFVEAQSPDERLELVTCNPCLVLGPLLNKRMSLSLETVKRLLGREMPGVPHIGFSVVDVRDVAVRRGHSFGIQPEVPFILLSFALDKVAHEEVVRALGILILDEQRLPLPGVLPLVFKADVVDIRLR